MAGTPTTVAAPEVGQGSWRPGSDARPRIRFCLAAHLRQARTTLRRAEESVDLWLRCEHETEGHGLSPRTVSTLFDAALGFRIRNPTHRAAVLILTGGIHPQPNRSGGSVVYRARWSRIASSRSAMTAAGN